MSAIESLEKLCEWANDRLDGYAHADVMRLADEIEAEIEERYTLLPLDVDGVPIRVGDKLECHANGYDGVFAVFAIGNDVVVGDHDIEWVARNPTNWFHVASFCTHAKPRTLEDMLADFAADVEHDRNTIETARKYAKEIRELMGVDDD